MPRYALLSALVLLLVVSGTSSARPVTQNHPVLTTGSPSLEDARRSRGGPALSWHDAFDDTVLYGGTVWAPDSNRWEAIRGGHWSFDSGVGSSINAGANPNKPIGYHQTMEGWFGVDRTLNTLPYFRRSSTCVIDGSFSLWAGVTSIEAGELCFTSGQGYGNSWDMTVSKSFAYGGAGNVTFSFDYAVDSEPLYDFSYALIDTSGNGSAEDLVLWTLDGTSSGTETITLNPGADMRSSVGPYIIKFRVASDGSYSDEDGLYATTCGHSAFDNVTVGADVTDFESGMNGWALEMPTTGVGDYSHLEDAANLTSPTTFCPCAHSDSVLVFFDENGEHPLDQDNFAVSPWIDLLAGGDAGRPGKLLMFDKYSDTPLANYIFEQYGARYYPYVCPANGQITTSPFDELVFEFFNESTPVCNPVNAPRVRDYSATIPPGAEQVQLAFGVVSFCSTSPFGPVCTGISNTTPWYDNIALGVYGSAVAPTVLTTTFDRFQDNFAADGSLNPASTGRIDTNRIKNGAVPAPGMILCDTLLARGDGGNTEVRLVFRVRPGPFTSGPALALAASRWTAEPGLSGAYGGTWYSARMDTAEQNGAQLMFARQWMSTFHEADPGFQGHDRALDPNDPNRLANDILPDHIFTPGSRIDYFVAARYIPPDPRNPGGTNWATDPDTSGAYFREVEILPSSMAADTTWNCTLYVDHHDDRGLADQAAEEAGLSLHLGTGSGNAENERYDRYDVQTPSSNQLSFGRPASSDVGATLVQVLGYQTLAWHSGSLTSGQVTAEDVAVVRPWLELPGNYPRRFWGSGEGLMQSMHSAGGAPRSFLNDVLGVTQNCTSIRVANCPTGTAMDTTYCLPTVAVGGAYFATSPLPRARGNGCPDLLGFDLLNANPAVTGALGQLAYLKDGGSRAFASVANYNTATAEYRTVLDGVPVGRWRSNSGFYAAGCDDRTASHERTADVLTWFAAGLVCSETLTTSDVPEPGQPEAPRHRPSLGAAFPNPTPGAARLSFVNAAPNARVRLDILDVSGRLVRTLVNGPLPAGPHELSWDGRAADGGAVADGLYFYRMTSDGFTQARKLIVLR
jgi:hypothetical protein